MQTLYIDVYFLINFTVDLLALHFASRLSRLKTTARRLCLISSLGAFAAIAEILTVGQRLLDFGISVLFLLLCALLIAKRASVFRRFRFLFTFLLFEILIGGIVYSAYSLLDKYVTEYIDEFESGTSNRSALIFSLLILISIGVFKFMVFLFSDSDTEKSVYLEITVGDKTLGGDALIDTGNLVKDPMNMCPVLFVKPSFAEKLLPYNVIMLRELDSLDVSYRKRIRLVPVTRGAETHVMTGVRPDKVTLKTECGDVEAELTLAIDKEGGTYAGYELLCPACIYDDAR